MDINRDEIKRLVNSMCETVELMGTKGGLDENVGDAARMELVMYTMYLTASDGEISWDEANLISEISDIELTPTNVGQFIRDNNIYSTEFEQKVPVTIQIAVEVDNMLDEAGADTGAAKAVLETYKIVGEALIKADGDANENEVSNYSIYLKMLQNYVEENSNHLKKYTTGFVKNENKSDLNITTNGVTAPRKG